MKRRSYQSQADLTTELNQGRNRGIFICGVAGIIISGIGIYLGDGSAQRALSTLLFLMSASEFFARFRFYKTKFYLLCCVASLFFAAICFIDYIYVCMRVVRLLNP